MVATITGMICSVNHEGAKDREGNAIPTVDIYSGGEVVKVRGVKVNEKLVGSYIDVLCKIQLKDWEGRKYISVEALPKES